MVLDTQYYYDETFQGPLAVLNLASASHLHLNLINGWIISVLGDDIEFYTKRTITQTSLAVGCKILGGISSICNNRALNPCRWTELFTGIQNQYSSPKSPLKGF